MRRALLVGCLVVASACGPKPAAPRAAPPAAAPAGAHAPEPVAPPRALAADAVFADLVRSAGALDTHAEASGPCLLGRDAAGYTFGAEVAVALRPLPQPAQDLDEVLKRAPHVQLLSPWGRYSAGDSPLALAALTAAPPRRRALALILTDRGVSVRGVAPNPEPGGAPDRGGQPSDSAAPRAFEAPADVAALGSLAATSVFVAAEALTPLSDVYDLLEELARLRAEVVLAVNLAPDTALPPLHASAPASQRLCPDGLPPHDAIEGDLPVAELLAGIEPLRARAPDCLDQADIAGAAGGRLTLALRIEQSGAVREACVVADETGDAALETCVLGLARQLRFAQPSPAGVVDAELPLALRPNSPPAQQPVCPPTQS